MYVSVAGGFVVDLTTNPAQPPVMTCGVELWSVVACDAPPVLELKRRLIESFAEVTVFPAASLRQTVIVDVELPLAGMGFGETDALSCVGDPKPEKEMVELAGVSVPDVAVAVHDSATASLIVNFTVVPLAAVLAVAGLPVPPAGVVPVTVAPHRVALLGWVIVRVTGVGPKTLFPPASCTWTVTSQVEPGLALEVGVLEQVLPVMASFAAGPEAVTDAVAEPD